MAEWPAPACRAEASPPRRNSPKSCAAFPVLCQRRTAQERWCMAMTTDELSQLVQAAFPVEPLPSRYWINGVEPLEDIPQEFAKGIAYRPWVDVTMLDWTMTGVHASTFRRYLDVAAFRYYLPSLLVGGLNDFGYIDWTLECILPAGRNRRTTANWWQEFWAGFSDLQRDAIRRYLIGVRSMLNESIHSVELQLIDEAQVIWGS